MGWELSNSQGNLQQVSKELTARQIFDKLLKGETVRIPNDPVLAEQLKNHLNVIKSRDKKVFIELGFDFISSVISITPFYKPSNPVFQSELLLAQVAGFEIKLIAPKKRRVYPIFSILSEEQNDTSSVVG